ncbi:MAG: zinc-ribbon domain-containing protein [Sedimentisphaerales bacterium]|nr:zinc-ribbon domain-containing protein [Sedimentisphaerales bacterium]
MALVNCPECGKEISDKALMCPHCGYAAGKVGLAGLCYEYRSKRELFGLPMVHIVYGMGIDPVTGRLRVAKGIIAIGNIAVGGLAIGGVSLGILSLGGLAAGLAVFGGMAVGLLAFGGMAIGLIAVGGGAVGYYALGGGAWGKHALGGNASDPEAVEFFKRFLGSYVEKLQQKSGS